MIVRRTSFGREAGAGPHETEWLLWAVLSSDRTLNLIAKNLCRDFERPDTCGMTVGHTGDDLLIGLNTVEKRRQFCCCGGLVYAGRNMEQAYAQPRGEPWLL